MRIRIEMEVDKPTVNLGPENFWAEIQAAQSERSGGVTLTITFARSGRVRSVTWTVPDSWSPGTAAAAWRHELAKHGARLIGVRGRGGRFVG